MDLYMQIFFGLLSIAFQLCLAQDTITPEEYQARINMLFSKLEARSNFTTPRPTYVPLKGCPAGMECTPTHLCNANGTIIIDGSTGFTERFVTIPECPSLEVCCAIDEKDAIPTKPTTVTEGPRSELRGSPAKCGIRNSEGIGYRVINNGEVAQYGEFPWVVAILHQVDGKNVLKCGGSLIHPSVVITGAHCVRNISPSSIIVRAGEFDTQTTSEIYEHQESTIKEIVMHPDFCPSNLHYDIAIIFFEYPFNFTDHIQPICLPPADINFENERCIAAGWGKNNFEKVGIYSVPLRAVTLPIVPRDACQNQLRATVQLGKRFQLHETILCAGGEPEKDTCKGDGGSPLMCESAGHYYLYGMVAWGIGCGKPLPAAYVNVPYFKSWLDEELAKKNINNTYYTP